VCLKRPHVNRTRAPRSFMLRSGGTTAANRSNRDLGRGSSLWTRGVSRSRNGNKGAAQGTGRADIKCLYSGLIHRRHWERKGERHSSCYLTSGRRRLINVPSRPAHSCSRGGEEEEKRKGERFLRYLRVNYRVARARERERERGRSIYLKATHVRRGCIGKKRVPETIQIRFSRGRLE